LLTVGVLAVGGPARAADEKPAGPMDSKALDTALYNNLRDVINRGAALYNSGDQAGCYRLFEGALMAVRPLLAGRKELQDAIAKGLTEAEQDPMLGRRAFVLRSVLDKVRDEIGPKGKAAGGAPAPGAGRAKTGTAWDRMGGAEGVRKIVDDLADVASKDPKVDFSRGGTYKPTPADIKHMKQMIVEQISSVTGGPLAYEGKSMVEVHKNMGITNDQFDAFVKDLREVLRKNNVDPQDAADLVSKVESTRKEIVQPKPAPGGGGTGEKKKPIAAAGAQVTGRVTFEGKPLAGEITLHDPAGKTTKGTIKDDGSYQLKDVKPGTYTVTMKTDAKDVKLPKQYGDPKTSPLVAEIKEGNQTRDYELKR
jgi:hemoglobin